MDLLKDYEEMLDKMIMRSRRLTLVDVRRVSFLSDLSSLLFLSIGTGSGRLRGFLGSLLALSRLCRNLGGGPSCRGLSRGGCLTAESISSTGAFRTYTYRV